MASSQTSIWDHAFIFPWPPVRKFHKIAKLLSKVKFYGKSKIYTLGHLYQFNEKCLFLKIINQGAFYNFFARMFKGQIRKWFNPFIIGPFTHGNNSCNCLYSNIRIMIMISCVKKLNPFKEKNTSPLLFFI
jgi:hypothetical protein